MNMFLHGMDNFRIEWGDTLRNPRLIAGDKLMQFDIVVANPPFSLDQWGAEEAEADPFRRYRRGVPPKGKADWAFITHMVERGIPISVIKAAVGHISPRMTEHYTHISTGTQRDAVRILDSESILTAPAPQEAAGQENVSIN